MPNENKQFFGSTEFHLSVLILIFIEMIIFLSDERDRIREKSMMEMNQSIHKLCLRMAMHDIELKAVNESLRKEIKVVTEDNEALRRDNSELEEYRMNVERKKLF